MKFRLFFSALLLNAGTVALAYAQTDAPRQLGGAPTLPPPARPRTAPAPPPPGSAADTTRRAAVDVPAPGPATAPVFVPPAPGQLPGNNTSRNRFQVGLKNGLVYNAADVEVKTPLFGRSHLLLDGQRKLELAEVGFYEDETGHYVRTTLPGASRESTLRRDKTGRISLYSITSSQYNAMPGGMGMGGMGMGGMGMGGMGMGGMGMGGYRTVKTEYFSKDNGPVQSMTNRNLMLATSDNAGAQQLLMDSRRYQRLTMASYAVGGGLLLAGLVQSFRPSSGEAGISRLAYAAIPVLIVPLILQGKQGNNQRQAIALYNAVQ